MKLHNLWNIIKAKFLFLLKWVIYAIIIIASLCATIIGFNCDKQGLLFNLGTAFLTSSIPTLAIDIINTTKECNRKKKVIIYANSSFLEDLNNFIIALQRIINDIYYEYYEDFNHFKFSNVNIIELFNIYAEKLEDIDTLAAPITCNNAITKEDIECEKRQQILIKKIKESEIELEVFRKKFIKHKEDFQISKNTQIVSDIIVIDDYKFLKTLYEVFGIDNNCSSIEWKRKEISVIKDNLKEILRLFDFKQFKKLGYKNKYYNNLKGYLDCEPQKTRS